MTLEQMLLALENGKVAYGDDDDYLLLPLDTAHKIAKAVRAGQALAHAVYSGESDQVAQAMTNYMRFME